MGTRATINVSVSSNYRENSYSSEIVTQGTLGERVVVLEHTPLFSKIRQDDGYESWISTDQLVLGDQPDGRRQTVRSHFALIREQPSPHAAGVRDVVIGSTLFTGKEENGWTQITLPDGQQGWLQSAHFGSFAPPTPAGIIDTAKEFLGCQYLWGGSSPKGFDCSGFVQTVFSLHGIQLPRDAWQQYEQHQVSRTYSDALPGDLLFFANTPERVTHVAISLGHERFIHASGWVKCNSFDRSSPDFSQKQLDTFVSVNRYPF